ncbi:hypothetical protein [Epilithonimonas vandammei]|uniref:Uncharacterized protein n=1 Tax=Epilithonimonas vandammei TaxID=2487072 RepID=A0A3G8Y2R6_9FLAO|nr:hypothetical protein [Epilithonimonas vandammei]AZI39193.1 hypothetical protein EIB74_04115 [Epilithonimonas vandammei]
MYKKFLLLISVLLLLTNCKKDEIDCQKQFYDLYTKRYSLWIAMDKNEILSNDNFTEKEYNALKNNINDSLQITVDCALKNDRKNEILYLYKMKQLFLSNQLKEVSPFLKTVDKNIVKEDIYFQLSLFDVLCKELLLNRIQIKEYTNLQKYYYQKLNVQYKDRAIKEFLNYLINDNIEDFKKDMKKKYPNSSSMSLENESNRQSIIKEIMVRGDNLVFD